MLEHCVTEFIQWTYEGSTVLGIMEISVYTILHQQ